MLGVEKENGELLHSCDQTSLQENEKPRVVHKQLRPNESNAASHFLFLICAAKKRAQWVAADIPLSTPCAKGAIPPTRPPAALGDDLLQDESNAAWPMFATNVIFAANCKDLKT